MTLKKIINWAELKVASLNASGIKAALTINQPNSNSSVRIDIDTYKYVGRITFWENGSCDQELLDIASGQQAFHRNIHLNDLDFEKHLKDFFTSAKI